MHRKFVGLIDQPKRGYLNHGEMDVKYFGGNVYYVRDEFGTGTILVSKAIKYLSDYVLFRDKESIFKKSFLGAEKLNQYETAVKLSHQIKGLDKESIIACCKLCSFDVVHETGMPWYKQIDKINPSDQVIYNIEGMANRTIQFLTDKIVLDRDVNVNTFVEEKKIYGYVDYLTDDTIWNLKVISGRPAKYDTVNLLYCLLALHDKNITKLGLFNPRQNVTYTYDIENLSDDIKEKILKETNID